MIGAKGWMIASAGGLSIVGMGFLTQSVEIPLGGVLVLTFVPTREITEGISKRINPGKRKDNAE